MNWIVERVGSCPSTQELARTRAQAGAPDGTVVVAEEQTGGHGTRGRAWHSPKGGLYVSIVFRDLKDARLLTLALGAAVAEALEIAGVDAKLKWVNDVLVGGKKIAGVLVESESTGPRFDFIVAGIGINVNGHAAALPADVRALATTLEDELHCDSCIPDLQTVVLECIARWVGVLRSGRAEEILAAFRARDALAGKRVRVSAADGAAMEGPSEGIDEHGRLRVRTSGGLRLADGGTVTLLA